MTQEGHTEYKAIRTEIKNVHFKILSHRNLVSENGSLIFILCTYIGIYVWDCHWLQ